MVKKIFIVLALISVTAGLAWSRPFALLGGVPHSAAPLPTGNPIGADADGNRYVGIGCSTVFYIDRDCDGYGIGKRADGNYKIGMINPARDCSANMDTMGDPDMVDADDTDPDVQTTAQWEAKWIGLYGSKNEAIKQFLAQKKNFTNTSRIYYVSKTGNDSTAVVNDPDHPWRYAYNIIEGPLHDRQGGVIIVRGGTWQATRTAYDGYDKELFLGGGTGIWDGGYYSNANLMGSPGHPVYVMNYPGEKVINQASGGGYFVNYWQSGDTPGYITYDGIDFYSPWYGCADGIGGTNVTQNYVINSEMSGYHQVIFGENSNYFGYINNVFHNMQAHAIYFTYSSRAYPYLPNGDFDFVTDAASANPNQLGHGVINYNVAYNNGSGGFEPFHINAYAHDMEVIGNVGSYSGGVCVGFQTGVMNSVVKNNICNGVVYGFAMNPGSGTDKLQGQADGQANQRNNVIENNTFYGGPSYLNIRGKNPSGGMAVSTRGTTYINYNDNIVRNNIFVYDQYAAVLDGPIGMYFDVAQDLSTWTIQNNIIVSSNASAPSPSNQLVMGITDIWATEVQTAYTLSQFEALHPTVFNNNHVVDPQFIAAQPTWVETPGLIDMQLQATSPAINAGVTTGAPADDARTRARSGLPDIGGYEYYAP